MFDDFEILRVISLPQRRDRRREMESEIARAGLAGDPRIAFFDALRPSDAGPFSSIGARGCYQSHVKILEEAVRKKASVLILEDDCDLAPDAGSISLGSGWQIFYGGYMPAEPNNLQHSDIIGSHMMGFSREGAQLVLEYLRNLDVDGKHPPIDAAYIWFRRAHPEVTTVFAQPPIGHQRPSRSDIEPGAIYNRLWGVRDMVASVRRLRRTLTRRSI
ncbi:glycosyltransferase family 25 protein [Sphingomonas sp. M1-B02]|uniref:glycosyltransferase family 25 protein n=1 Tax=Sphingomonas sp. M1-B02 TaxID=3114300 RepID=UPI0022401DBA|nr:glycosyltransferase family 25 protein [Sphingomonas sp. S6-11]UZK67747.1 glycosyltransferase family 25 protein [Sphingomonas sp. S6-11]